MIHGYLNRLRRNLRKLDNAIEDTSKAVRGERPADKRARLKLLRDLIELQSAALAATKTHLLGRDSTGSPTEPPENWDDNPTLRFERVFASQLESDWTKDDLEEKCSECGESSMFVDEVEIAGKTRLLCDDCSKKLEPQEEAES